MTAASCLVDRLDHLVLTVADLAATVRFYEALGFEHHTFDGRSALHFGSSKINLHQVEHTFEPKAANPTPGSADLCFVTGRSLSDVQAVLADAGIEVVEGPVDRTGALGPIRSVYVRDPDHNLVEIASYDG